MCDITELTADCGTNPPGIQKLYWIRQDKVSGVAAIDMATLTVDGVISLVSGQWFLPLEAVLEETELKEELVGPVDSQSIKYTLTAQIKGLTPAVMATLQEALGAKIIILVGMQDGRYKLLGNTNQYCQIITAPTTTGKLGSTDRKGALLTIECHGNATYAPFYDAYNAPVQDLLA